MLSLRMKVTYNQNSRVPAASAAAAAAAAAVAAGSPPVLEGTAASGSSSSLYKRMNIERQSLWKQYWYMRAII
jgi:hypothetical protein